MTRRRGTPAPLPSRMDQQGQENRGPRIPSINLPGRGPEPRRCQRHPPGRQGLRPNCGDRLRQRWRGLRRRDRVHEVVPGPVSAACSNVCGCVGGVAIVSCRSHLCMWTNVGGRAWRSMRADATSGSSPAGQQRVSCCTLMLQRAWSMHTRACPSGPPCLYDCSLMA